MSRKLYFPEPARLYIIFAFRYERLIQFLVQIIMPPDVHISSPGRMASKTGLLLNVAFRPGHYVVHGLGIAFT